MAIKRPAEDAASSIMPAAKIQVQGESLATLLSFQLPLTILKDAPYSQRKLSTWKDLSTAHTQAHYQSVGAQNIMPPAVNRSTTNVATTNERSCQTQSASNVQDGEKFDWSFVDAFLNKQKKLGQAAAENPKLKEEIIRLKQEKETTISDNLDLAIKYNALQHDLKKAEELSEMRAKAIEVGKNAIVERDIPLKRFFEAADEVEKEKDRRLMEEVDQTLGEEVSDEDTVIESEKDLISTI